MSGNELKIIAAIFMFLDHLGYEVFPKVEILRILGRLAFPVFSYFIYEGCKYTHNRWKYFLRLFGLGMICLFGYYIFSREWYGNILLTLSLSVCNIFAVRYWKQNIVEQPKSMKPLLGCLFVSTTVIGSYLLCHYFMLDYGFYGVMLPVFAELFDLRDEKVLPGLSWIHHPKFHLVGFFIGLVLLSINMPENHQIFCLLTVPLLMFYNGKRGKWKMKYFFYLYYPLHLMVVELIAIFMR